jgi:hypothetical protein
VDIGGREGGVDSESRLPASILRGSDEVFALGGIFDQQEIGQSCVFPFEVFNPPRHRLDAGFQVLMDLTGIPVVEFSGSFSDHVASL